MDLSHGFLMKNTFHSIVTVFCLAFVVFSASYGFCQSTDKVLNDLRMIGSGDKEAMKASALAARLNRAEDLTLAQVLQAMKGATPIGRNWLSGVANSRYRLHAAKSQGDLEKILKDTTQDGEARYKAFVWLTQGDEKRKADLLPSFMEDPSPELRYTSIASQIPTAKEAPILEKLLAAARHPDQVIEIIKKLDEIGVKVEQSKHFGFIKTWNLIGPFDHVGAKNFDKVFAIEEDWAADKVQKTYEGKTSNVSWLEYTTEEKDGNVDLAKIFSNEKGCIVYAATEFNSPIDGPAEIRLGCINGHKIWLNGELVMSNEVYHSSSQIDQYIEPIQLKKGKNRILIKICQNEQKEPWAQRYQYMVRISDSTGKAIQAN
jgi:hypothetical protein